MNVREKLVELLNTNACPAPFMCDPACRYYGFEDCFPDRFADHLIAHGVTVQEWIPVKKHLPQENEPEDTVCELVQVLLVNGDVSTGWCNRRTKLWWHFSYGASDFIDYDYDHTPVIAWQPLAQPPKGE